MVSQSEFSIVVGEHKDGLRRIELWVGSECLTGDDSFVYPPAFLHAVANTANYLRAELNFLRHEAELLGLGIEDAFELVSSGDLHDSLRIFSWGPTMDDCLCFLLPLRGRLWLAWKKIKAKTPCAVPIVPYDLISTMKAAISKLEADLVS